MGRTRRGRPSGRERAIVAATARWPGKRGRQDGAVHEIACVAVMRPPIPPKEEIFGSEFPDITDPVAVLLQVCDSLSGSAWITRHFLAPGWR